MMFDSHSILSTKGPLSNILVAGYFYKRLKKRQVSDTDIPSSVDKILLEGLPFVTYRVLAYLLLGVVRIYSKKVEYLYQECDQTVTDINRFSLSKKTVPFRDLVRRSYSISLPQRYELDTFQLEVTASASRDHVSRKEDISLIGTLLFEAEMDKNTLDQYSLQKARFEDGPLHSEELENFQALSGGSGPQYSSSPVQTPEKPASDKATSRLGHTPPDNVLSPPHQMEIDVDISSPKRMKDFELSKEKLREMRFDHQDERLDDDMICELDVELLNLVNQYEVEVQTKVEGNDDVQEKTLLQNHDHTPQKDDKVTFPVEKTSGGSDVADHTDATTPQFVVAPTPIKDEALRRPYKRKCVIDEPTVLNNEIMKQSIKDASALICKRRKAPYTGIDVWRLQRFPVLLKDFVAPLLPCVALELENVHCTKKTETQLSVDTALIEPVETIQIPGKLLVAASPLTPGDSRALAPGTPVRCSTSARPFGIARGADSDGEGGHFYDNLRRDFGLEEDLAPKLMEEMDANEGDSGELVKDKDGWSTRTRNVAKFLHKVYQAKQQQGEESITLLPITKHKSKKESARLFFEVLVLSTGGFMKVTQQKAYADVILQETSKMEAALQNS